MTKTEARRWAALLDSAAAYIIERSTAPRAVWERNWLRNYESELGQYPTLVERLHPSADGRATAVQG